MKEALIMGNDYDAIVIGAGQNGLTTAAYLAKAGLEVAVLEQQPWIGGSTITKELTLPGFKHDVCSTGITFAMGNPAITQDELDLKSKYGLDIIGVPDPDTVGVYDDGTVFPIYNDIDKTCDAIAQFSEHDAKAYREFYEYVQPMVPMLQAGMFNAPPRMGMLFNQLDQTPLGQEFMKVMFMSAWDLIKQRFTHPKTMILLLSYPAEAMVDPEEGGSALYVLSMVAVIHSPGKVTAYGRGGIQNLTNSLVRSIEDHGGVVLTEQEVVEIKTTNGRATSVICANGEEYSARKVIVSNVDPRLTLNKWLDVPLEGGLNGKIDRIVNPAFVGEMVHLALDKEPEFIGGGKANSGVMLQLLPTSLEDFRQSFVDIRLGKVPYPVRMLAVFPHRVDPSRAPEGKGVAYLWEFVPYSIANGGAKKWDEVREEVAAGIIKRFLQFTTNFSEKDIIGKCILSPLDYERQNQNMVNGQVLGPGPGLYQYMSFRPTPELGQYRTPITGLYLSGQSTHPGGGVTLGGRATAQVIMQDIGIDFDDLF
ncbi:MAG: NAD(P)/FAD-dependent oxidoreductase [Coriobacteriales bacterium]|jgi:phytoene dehydrogenase-like protein|nr:NAD(P)/FAD-dependent oxidoreductase [Coriobacteriales bacterium]